MKQALSILAFLYIASTSFTMAQTGTCTTTENGIMSGENGEIFQAELLNYKVNESALSKTNFNGISLKVVLGNWCEDSQREVPRLMKMLGTLPMSNVPVTYYLVNREKYCADPEVQKLDVKFVPAIIIYRNDKELGRIIETPEGSLEAHIVKIVGE